MEDQIKVHPDKAQISELLIRYFMSIDEKQFTKDIIETTFTTDARILKPNGLVTAGYEEILQSNIRSFSRFKATHHVTTDYLISINGDEAAVRANLTGMHLWADDEANPSLNSKHFYAGIVLTAKAVRTNGDWRISELAYRNIWRTGDGMAEMAKFARPES